VSTRAVAFLVALAGVSLLAAWAIPTAHEGSPPVRTKAPTSLRYEGIEPARHLLQKTSCAGYVGLTFDDAPTGNTQNLIDALRSAGLRATMFNIGQRAQNNPALVRAQLDAGLWIGNHTFTHPHLPTLTEAQVQSQLQQTQNVMQQATGAAPRLFRPPYGETNETIRSVAQQLGLTEILWDIDSEDWRGATSAKIVETASFLGKGMIILMHDMPTTTAAIPQIAADLAGRRLCAGMISPTTGRPVAPDTTT
jgi:peptidoglycan/xylan/chitin deacetylase (PgdA/CDA1 family)